MEAYWLGATFSVAAAMCWAVAVVLYKRSGETLPPLTLSLFKDTVAVAVFLPAAVLVEGSLFPSFAARETGLIALSGVLGVTLADTLFFAALNRLGAGLTAIVDCAYSPSMVLLAVVFLGDDLHPLAIVGGGLVVSATLLASVRRPGPGRRNRDIAEGIAFGVAAMFLVAGSIVVIKPILNQSQFLRITALRLVAGTALLFPIVFLMRGRTAVTRVFRPSAVWKFAIPAAVIGNVVAMGLWLAGMERMRVSTSAILNQLSTIFIFVLAWAVLKERITARRTAAVALAFIGAVLVLLGGGSG